MAIGTPVERYAVARTGLGATTTLSPATTIQAGTRAILIAAGPTAGKTISSVTDDAGNTWTVDGTRAGASDNVAIASCHCTTQITTSNVITITWSSAASNNRQIWVQEVSGLASVSAADKTAGAQGTSTTPSSGNTAALAQADEFVIGAVRFNTATWTKGASYSNVTTPVLGTGTAVEYKIVAATTAVAADGSLNASVAWAALVVTYKGASAHSVTLTPATETDAAQVLSTKKRVTLTPATESDAAQTLSTKKCVTLTPASEAGVAQALVVTKRATLTPVLEVDTAQALEVKTRVTLTPALELDVAQALSVVTPRRSSVYDTEALEVEPPALTGAVVVGDRAAAAFEPALGAAIALAPALGAALVEAPLTAAADSPAQTAATADERLTGAIEA